MTQDLIVQSCLFSRIVGESEGLCLTLSKQLDLNLLRSGRCSSENRPKTFVGLETPYYTDGALEGVGHVLLSPGFLAQPK